MKYIQLFESLAKQTPNEILKEYDLTTKELDRIIDILTKYKLDDILLRELKSTQDRGYRDLRKWKVDSFISRYEVLRPRIEELMEVQDYFLELSDMGYGILVSSRDRTVRIRIGGNKKRDLLNSISEVVNFLKQLKKSSSSSCSDDWYSIFNNLTANLFLAFIPVRGREKDMLFVVSYDSPTLVDRWY